MIDIPLLRQNCIKFLSICRKDMDVDEREKLAQDIAKDALLYVRKIEGVDKNEKIKE